MPSPSREVALAEKRPEPALRLEIEVVAAGQEIVVRLRGEAGVTEAGVLETSLSRVHVRRPARVIFDLRELRFLSSLAMAVLVSYLRAAVRAGVRVCLATALHPAVREALDRAKLMDLFEIVSSAEPSAGPGPSETVTRKVYPNVDDVQRAHGIAWGELIQLEPQVETLLWRARQVSAGCRTFAEVDRAFSSLRDELTGLIGFASKHHWHPVLGSAGAYEVAYWKLYDAVAGLLPSQIGGLERAAGA
jgi:anti-anti-sigma factor